MTERLILRYDSERENSRVVRIWERLGENTVREIDTELMYNFQSERWETTHEFVTTYDVTNDGVLIGDGSDWSGEGRHWKRHAEIRHDKRLALRYPYEQGEKEQTPTVQEVAQEQIKANF